MSSAAAALTVSANDSIRIARIGIRPGRRPYPIANSSYCIGRNTYSIPGDKEANAMFTRNYREGFVVPKKV